MAPNRALRIDPNALPPDFDATQPLGRDKYERFALEFTKDFAIQKAATRAGYKPLYGHILIRMPEIAARIQQLVREQFDAMCVSDERVMKELALVGFANLADMIQYTPNGDPVIELGHLSRDQMASLSEVQVEDGKDGKRVRVKQHDKLVALDKLCRIRALFDADNVRHNLNTDMGDTRISDEEFEAYVRERSAVGHGLDTESIGQ